MITNRGYMFIPYSSKDIGKDIGIVRKIRNAFEEKDGNPILFYLKYLENDTPQSENKQLLKTAHL